jgi:WD40 repeat protein
MKSRGPGSDGRIRFWSIDKSAWLEERDIAVGEFIDHFVFFPDGTTLAAVKWNGRQVRLYDVVSGAVRDTLDAGEEFIGNSLTVSPDGGTLLVGCGRSGQAGWQGGGDILFWNLTDRRGPTRLREHEDMVYAMAYSPDGAMFASASLDGIIKLWDARTFSVLITLHADSTLIGSLCFSPDGQTLASGGSKAVKLWHVETGQLLASLDTFSEVFSLVFSTDGTTLAAGLGDGKIQLWHASMEKTRWPTYLY